MSSYIEIRNLSHHFISNNEELQIFKDLSFSLEKGEFLCVLGASGCGKTTLLRCLAGFIKPTDGEIFINGNKVENPGRHCSIVFQTFDQLLPWKTVLGNVVYPLRINKEDKVPKAEAIERAKKYLDMVGLSSFINYFPFQLSGGMKQRVAIARSLAMEPSLILMDEPFASLDVESRMSLQKELLKIWKETNVTVLFVTHSIIEAIALSTKMMVLGPCPEGIKLVHENNVVSEPGVPRTPKSPNYTECWDLINGVLRNSPSDGDGGV